MVQADLSDLGSLSRAFDGVHAVFLNTDFWGSYRTSLASGADDDRSRKLGFDTEVAHGKNAVDSAAGIQTLERLVYSALGPMKAASGRKYSNSFHWETKASIVEYIEKRHPELAAKTSFLYLGAYSTNPFLLPKISPNGGEYIMALPAGKDTRFPIIDTVRSTGAFVRALVEDENPGTKLLAYDDASDSRGSVGNMVESHRGAGQVR